MKKDTNPLVSVVLPVYNGEQYLERTLDALERQTMPDFEVLMVDDGSTDASASIMRRREEKDGRFRMLTRPNGGLSAARNTGIEASRGEWLYFIDADDTLHPDALKCLVEEAVRKEVPVMIGGFFESEVEKWPGEKDDDKPKENRNGGRESKVMTAPEALRIGLYQHRRINNAWGMLLKASLFRGEDGLRFKEGYYYEDLELFPRLCLRAGKIGYLATPLYFYRQHPGSFLHTFSPSRLDALLVTDGVCRLMERELPELLPAARDRRFSAAFNILLLLERMRPEGQVAPRYRVYGDTYAEIAEHCRRVIRQGRREALRDPEVRRKNKLGAIASYFGPMALRLMSRLGR